MKLQPTSTARSAHHAARSTLEVSIILPCLNEERTVAQCVKDAKKWLGKKRGEVIVVDNGSSDDSRKIAKAAGAKVISQPERGYGAAIYKGFMVAKGKYIIIADADLSYDLAHLTPFLQKLHQGYDVVIGNRFGKKMQAGAMPWLHKYVGNPILTRIANLFFGTHLSDYHSGVRAIKKSVIVGLGLQCKGMEFASEMIVRAALHDLKISEVSVKYRRDGRDRKPHIRTFRDGWRHLRFLMLFAPNWIFFFPAVCLLFSSLSLLLWMVVESLHFGKVTLGIHTMLVCGGLLIIGYQLLHWSFCIKVFAQRIHLPIHSPSIWEKLSKVGIEINMLIGSIFFLMGIGLCCTVFFQWMSIGFGQLQPEDTMRVFIPGVFFVVLGVQIFFASLFLGLMQFEAIQ